MSDCATSQMSFETGCTLSLEAAFDGGRITSDGGLVWLSKIDSEMALCEAISECVEEWRTRRGRHSLLSLLRQRVFQIASGYEDQNDSDTLREDPLLKAVCSSMPESGENLASQPTMCRLERTPPPDARATGSHRSSSSFTSKSGGKTVSRRRSSWISTQPTTPPTEIRKARITMATIASICIILFSSSTARVDTSSRRSCGRETPTPRTHPWRF